MGVFGVVFIVLLVIKVLGLAALSWWIVFTPVILWVIVLLGIIFGAVKFGLDS